MNLLDIVHRRSPPEPWAEGENIPWNDGDFGRRMLKEHLSQEHDWASRRFEVIEQHVAWIHREVLSGHPARILDLGCGPGLYASRFSKLGHDCVGIDYSPVSIAYARELSVGEGLRCTYVQGDIRTTEYGMGYGLVMLIFGEFNVFRPTDAQAILVKAYCALVDGGAVLLEPHTYAAVRDMGETPTSWYSTDRGLFSDWPHLCLHESFWDAEANVETDRYFIVDARTGGVTRHASSMQAYTDEQYRTLLEACRFEQVECYPSLTGSADGSQGGLIVVVARKQRAT